MIDCVRFFLSFCLMCNLIPLSNSCYSFSARALGIFVYVKQPLLLVRVLLYHLMSHQTDVARVSTPNPSPDRMGGLYWEFRVMPGKQLCSCPPDSGSCRQPDKRSLAVV
ncbi:hypothetical protein G7K_1600-t1 [Saitoella complicata NRRL Y-17804]|uniref:Secreted protein n=1 Tax=Saitoella complicata (strain BCRC 22490 / CBS 7301 / JCM 7358 / NBRC 10748 / NRRL Y-17804) TaxID=698492 RepID=A0A0E9NC12_SAICN|nr:hypothetical protein G7K_1600-t1 [Saitoella complicata NRRL Y-17804]